MKHYLFFSTLEGASEECNVFYSTLVIAKTEEEAIEKYVASCRFPPNLEKIGIRKMEPIQ